MKIEVCVLPDNKIIHANKGDNLLDTLAKNGFVINASCGGHGSCGKCLVKLKSGEVDGTLLREDNTILSCKAILKENITVEVSVAKGNGLDDFSKVVGNRLNESGFSIALDIGTTTLACALIDRSNGQIIKKTSALNPQCVYGADVLSRIKACDEGKLPFLHSTIIEKTNELISELAQEKEILELAVCANTTMLHLFANENPESIGRYPFTPIFTNLRNYLGSDLGVKAKTVYLLPSASAYIGSDITAGIYALNMHESKKTRLLVDIGTNGEIALVKNGKIFAVSTAAGPALEGACIDCGVGGVSGAIDKVYLKEKELSFTTIANAAPIGICGSGLISLIALLVKQGIIDETGSFDETADTPLVSRLQDDKFFITEKIYLSQKDIRQYQLAKSAICAGIETLLCECSVDLDAVESVYLAGGLGYYMSVPCAMDTGLIPKAFAEKTSAVGNSGLAGVVKWILSNDDDRKIISDFAKNIEIKELSFSKLFQDLYIERMIFEIE